MLSLSAAEKRKCAEAIRTSWQNASPSDPFDFTAKLPLDLAKPLSAEEFCVFHRTKPTTASSAVDKTA